MKNPPSALSRHVAGRLALYRSCKAPHPPDHVPGAGHHLKSAVRIAASASFAPPLYHCHTLSRMPPSSSVSLPLTEAPTCGCLASIVNLPVSSASVTVTLTLLLPGTFESTQRPGPPPSPRRRCPRPRPWASSKLGVKSAFSKLTGKRGVGEGEPLGVCAFQRPTQGISVVRTTIQCYQC